MNQHRIKAIVATGIFALAGIASSVLFVSNWQVSLPLAIFYLVITINTFPSVHLFSSIAPEEDDDKHLLSDAVLSVLYILLAISLGDPVSFALTTTLLFIAATIKYAYMLHIVPHAALLKRKIIIDLFGTLLGAASLGIMLTGHVQLASWAMAGIFVVANIYFLWINPMYRIN
jgi:hypothetical protein